MSFTPAQFHFHKGVLHSNPENIGSEHTLNGQHFDLELHIVSLNLDEATSGEFRAAVTGLLFKVDETL